MAYHIHVGILAALESIAAVLLFFYFAHVLIVRYPNNPVLQGLAFIIG